MPCLHVQSIKLSKAAGWYLQRGFEMGEQVLALSVAVVVDSHLVSSIVM